MGEGYNLTRGGEGALGYIHTEEEIEKMKNSATGKHPSPETIKKLKESKSNISPETREKISNALKGIPKSITAKKNMSNSAKNRPLISSKTREKISNALRNRPPISPETREKLRESKRGKNNPNYKKQV